MKIFIDTANIKAYKGRRGYGVVDGVTTNPTLVSKEGRPLMDIVREISRRRRRAYSVEALSLECAEIVREAKKLAKIDKNIVVKIPLVKGASRPSGY
jgi:transaldolase